MNDYAPIKSLCLNVTDSCNFNCRYCFVNKAPNYMPFQVAEDAIKWVKNNSEDSVGDITFFGGEPMLCYTSIIEPLIKKYPELKYSITTNGSLLTKERINFFSENNVSILLSMDGDKFTQEYNRSINSFNYLDAIIPYLIEKIPNAGFRGTIIPNTCSHTLNNILYADQKGFKNCYFTINIFEQWSEENKLQLENEIKKFSFLYINSFLNNRQLINFTPFTNMIELLIKNKLNLLDNSINIYKCGLGNGYGAVNYKGDIFTCQEAITLYNNELFKIGNIYSGINYLVIDNLRAIMINDEPITNNHKDCSDCELSFCCKKTTCQVNNYLCNHNCLIQSYNQCWWNLLLCKYAKLSISILQTLPNFQNYMENIILEKEEK